MTERNQSTEDQRLLEMGATKRRPCLSISFHRGTPDPEAKGDEAII
jgi:hypothetical protein